MKLFSKKRLQVNTIGSTTFVRWWVLSFADIFLIFVLPIALISGIGNLIQAKEILGIEVIQLGAKANLIFWMIWTLLLFHIIFNRSAKLEISAEELIYKERLILGVFRKIKRSEITDVLIIAKTDQIAESPPDGRDLTTFELLICSSLKKPIRIKGLSKSDAEFIKNIITKP